ncbi:MAG: S-methyl-5-thioribose-1-phosphate isomerase [Eubacterium sp.]|nr:S-methyl-5-thioribose-1-phosphate isomerase [Eubacterium sp.]
MIVPVKYVNGNLLILDQTRLPNEQKYLTIQSKEDIFVAIKKLRVRGAPAIGVAAAYGLYVSLRESGAKSMDAFYEEAAAVAAYIDKARPTAVNLSWALNRMLSSIEGYRGSVASAKSVLFEEAEKIRKEDEQACLSMGKYGLSLLEPGMGLLTHCNAGTLATAKYGTSLSPIYLGQEKDYKFRVFVDETRPLLQGARLTAWELSEAGVDVTLICDNMASIVMKNGWINAVLVGCDRMAANGDGANKIGTSAVAILAHEYGIPFYMFVPTSTIDLSTPTGDDIPIELREGNEIYKMWYKEPMAPRGIRTYNPSFDITSNQYITAVITEKGIVYPPYEENLRKIMEVENGK